MRKIKYRAWDKEIKYMNYNPVFGELCVGVNGLTKIDINRVFGKKLPDMKKFVFMQWTGIKDRNGKYIFEGDIVRIRKNSKDYHVIEWTSELINDDMGYDWMYSGFMFPEGGTEKNMEVIGNIFEDKKLLK